jgi:Uncharacterized conserved protein (DUF2163)
MRKVTGGNGTDTTAAVATWLAAGNEFRLANLYLIGEPEDPMAVWLTDYEAPLLWPVWGTFQPAVISRGTVTSKIGLEVASLDVTWTPKQPAAFTQSVSTASPYQLAQLGYYDNWRVRLWTVYMPMPGDANTYGCSELFGGRVADTTVERGAIKFTVNSFLDVVNQYVPTNVIELTNTLASYTAATPPKGFSHIPQFNVVQGDSPTEVIGDMTYPNLHSILNANVCQHGYLVFNSGPGATLGGVWASIQQNIKITLPGGYNQPNSDYNQFILYTPLPWAPTPGVDTFYVSGQAPIDQSDGSYFGFPYVPNPTIAV